MISSKWPPLRTEQSPSQHWLFCYCHADGSSHSPMYNNIMTQNAVEYLLVNCYWKKGKQLSWELFVNTTLLPTETINTIKKERRSMQYIYFQCEKNSRDLQWIFTCSWTVIFVISKKKGVVAFFCLLLERRYTKNAVIFFAWCLRQMRVRRRDCFFLARQKKITLVFAPVQKGFSFQLITVHEKSIRKH